MARTRMTPLIVVDAITREPITRLGRIMVPTCGTWWVRSDAPGLVAWIGDAQHYAAVTGNAVDIVWPRDVTRSFEVSISDGSGRGCMAIECPADAPATPA